MKLNLIYFFIYLIYFSLWKDSFEKCIIFSSLFLSPFLSLLSLSCSIFFTCACISLCICVLEYYNLKFYDFKPPQCSTACRAMAKKPSARASTRDYLLSFCLHSPFFQHVTLCRVTLVTARLNLTNRSVADVCREQKTDVSGKCEGRKWKGDLISPTVIEEKLEISLCHSRLSIQLICIYIPAISIDA